MHGFLKTIKGTIPNTTKEVNINVEGKHLIITGGNGCGKTSFLNDLNYKFCFIIRSDMDKAIFEKYGGSGIIGIDNGLKMLFSTGLDVNNIKDIYYTNINKNKDIIKFYNADRKSQINEPAGISNTTSKLNGLSIQYFEQYLVDLKAKKSFAITEDKNKVLADNIDEWFKSLGQDLAYLIEDETTELKFDISKMKFYIQQQGKIDYTFQTLSRGYSAILAIWADLLMINKGFDNKKDELSGVVLIDEIDAHLHVSLQRKILPFLTKSFPNLQFVVTTHSPFIITSINDAVVYDISSGEEFNESLAMYSYETVVEGVLGVPPSAIQLRKEIVELSELIEDAELYEDEIQEILSKIDSSNTDLKNLDEEAQLVYYKARNAISLLKNKG
jgi:predicted ATP-binding protein involved in virulence